RTTSPASPCIASPFSTGHCVSTNGGADVAAPAIGPIATGDNDVAAICFSIDAECNLICSVFEVTPCSIGIDMDPSRCRCHTRGIKLFRFAALQFFKFAYSIFAMLHVQVDYQYACF